MRGARKPDGRGVARVRVRRGTLQGGGEDRLHQDIIVEGKLGLSGFASTNLDFIFHSRGIETFALCGCLSNCCVGSTMNTAYVKGCDVVTLRDCTATLSEEEQRLSVEKSYQMFSRMMTHTEFLEALASEQMAAGSGRGCNQE